MADLIEGRNPVLEALRSGRRLRRVLLAPGMKPNPALDEISRRARDAGVPLVTTPRRELDAKSVRGAHQGVIAEAEAFRYAQLHDVLKRAAGKDRSLVVAVDHVEDPGNLGAIVRSAEVVGADGVIVPKQRTAPMNAAALKAAAGAAEHIPVAQVPNLVRAIAELKDAGYWAAGASERAGQTAWEAPMDGRLVIVLGSEGHGLARLSEEACDHLVRLPVAGRVSSLNVAQAAAVLMYEWLRRGRENGP